MNEDRDDDTDDGSAGRSERRPIALGSGWLLHGAIAALGALFIAGAAWTHLDSTGPRTSVPAVVYGWVGGSALCLGLLFGLLEGMVSRVSLPAIGAILWVPLALVSLWPFGLATSMRTGWPTMSVPPADTVVACLGWLLMCALQFAIMAALATRPRPLPRTVPGGQVTGVAAAIVLVTVAIWAVASTDTRPADQAPPTLTSTSETSAIPTTVNPVDSTSTSTTGRLTTECIHGIRDLTATPFTGGHLDICALPGARIAFRLTELAAAPWQEPVVTSPGLLTIENDRQEIDGGRQFVVVVVAPGTAEVSCVTRPVGLGPVSQWTVTVHIPAS